MKKTLLALACGAVSVCCFASTTPAEPIHKDDFSQEGSYNINRGASIKEIITVADNDDDETFSVDILDKKPEFPGGEAAMFEWLSNHISYPSDAWEQGASGRVIVEFIVEKDGSITNVKIVRRRHLSLDKEALRVVAAMPRWTPGRRNGLPVRVIYTLPITFRFSRSL